MDIQYLIVYIVVGLAVWQLLRRFLPQPKKKQKAGKSCSACSACEPTAASQPDWMAKPRSQSE